jgi:hypothetical protein
VIAADAATFPSATMATQNPTADPHPTARTNARGLMLVPFRSARARLGARMRRYHRTVRVDLRGLSTGHYALRVTIRRGDGKIVHLNRVYDVCSQA